MKHMYTIYDSKAEAYHDIFIAPTKAVALRSFATAAQDENSQFHHYAEDFTLFEIGTWDDQAGCGKFYPAATPPGKAIEYVNLKTGPNSEPQDVHNLNARI